MMTEGSATSKSLAYLPPELLVHTFLHLSLSDLTSLCLVSRALHSAVSFHGWSTWLERNPDARRRQTLFDNQRYKYGGREAVKMLLAIDAAWQRKCFLARQIYFIDLPPPLGFAGPGDQNLGGGGTGERRLAGGKTEEMKAQSRKALSFLALSRQNQAIPILRLCGAGLLMALKSSICFWPASSLHTKKGIKEVQPRVVNLQPEEGGKKIPTAWEDISAMQIIEEGPTIVVGRVDGTLEIWKWDEIKTHQHSCPCLITSYRPESSTASSVQAISHLPSHRILTAAWKGGDVVVFELIDESHSEAAIPSAFAEGSARQPPCESKQLTLISKWTIDARPWAIHLGMTRARSSPWLVVGCQGIDFLRLYRFSAFLQPHDTSPEPPYTSLRVSSSATPPVLSAYALASSSSDSHAAFPPHLLFAGCYDGLIRLWDLRQLEGTTPHEDHGSIAKDCPSMLLPVQRFADRYDPSPVYSLCLGVASGSNCFAVGTARHGIVKIFQMGRDAQGTPQAAVEPGREWDHRRGRHERGKGKVNSRSAPQEGMSIYPPHPSADFPTYTVVGEHGRLFSAGAGRLWEFDARVPLAERGYREECGSDSAAEESVTMYTAESTIAKRQKQYSSKGRWEVDGWSDRSVVEDAESASTSVGWYYHGEMELKRSGIAN